MPPQAQTFYFYPEFLRDVYETQDVFNDVDRGDDQSVGRKVIAAYKDEDRRHIGGFHDRCLDHNETVILKRFIHPLDAHGAPGKLEHQNHVNDLALVVVDETDVGQIQKRENDVHGESKQEKFGVCLLDRLPVRADLADRPDTVGINARRRQRNKKLRLDRRLGEGIVGFLVQNADDIWSDDDRDDDINHAEQDFQKRVNPQRKHRIHPYLVWTD